MMRPLWPLVLLGALVLSLVGFVAVLHYDSTHDRVFATPPGER